MSDYLEEYKGYKLKIWTEGNNLFGGTYIVGKENRIWHECDLGALLELFYSAVDIELKKENKTMNWQTKELGDWLNEVGVLNSQRENIQELQELVESRLLVTGNVDCTDRIKNLAVTELLAKIEWGELIYNRDAWDDWGIDYLDAEK